MEKEGLSDDKIDAQSSAEYCLTCVPDPVIQAEACDTSLHSAVEIFLVDLQDLIHLAQIKRDAAMERLNMAFE